MKKSFCTLIFAFSACAFLSAKNSGTSSEENFSARPLAEYTIKKQEIIDVVYPGKGWIFIGAKNEKNTEEDALIFLGRLTQEKQQTFSFRAKKNGEFLLGFYKTDFLTNSYIDDCIKINVKDENGDPTKRNVANNYVFKGKKHLELPPQEEKNQETKSEEQPKNLPEKEKSSKKGLKTNVDEAKADMERGLKNNDVPYISPLDEARISLENGEYEKCEVALDKFFSNASNYEDEGIFLLASFYEALKNKKRNIKAAIASYDALCKNYPESALWNAARERLVYLKRFYIDIR